ncbi:MAG: hypothetical protein EBQ79_00765 [Actinobacteria bacterium]|nr:hypothetical protein [Actinomycetota bacterium]
MPLKFEAAELATDSKLLGTGVCNTLVRNDTGFSGYNTDVYGIHMAVKSSQRAPIKKLQYWVLELQRGQQLLQHLACLKSRIFRCSQEIPRRRFL